MLGIHGSQKWKDEVRRRSLYTTAVRNISFRTRERLRNAIYRSVSGPRDDRPDATSASGLVSPALGLPLCDCYVPRVTGVPFDIF